MTRGQAMSLRNKVAIGETVQALGGLTTDTEQSDKLGFDWKRTYVNGVLVKSEYVPQEVPMGTAENPIVWKEGMAGIDNAYYLVNGVRMVYMGGEFVEF